MESTQCNIKTLQGGRYHIESLLGSGGFANTYLATQAGLERKVAIKEFFMKEFCDRDETSLHVIVPTLGSKQIVDKYKAKFLKEAQMISSLRNDHIIQIYDIFEENDTAYYVMEYVAAGSLKDKIEREGPLSEQEAVKYATQIADALQYLHSNNILHLDVKPANILLDSRGSAILIDFGISKHYDEEGGQTSTTPAGISKGFAPIEQYQQGNMANFTPATDVYSLGATLFFLLTGETPPDASLVYEYGLPEKVYGFSESIKSTIVTAMSPRRKDRFQSIDEFIKSLTKDSTVKLESNLEETTIIIDPNNTAPSEDDSKTVIVVEENDDKIHGWMAFFLWFGIGLGLIISFIQALLSPNCIYSLIGFSIFAIVGIRTIWAFYKKRENAVALAFTYCIMIGMDALFLAINNLIIDESETWWKVLRGILWAGIWITYLLHSEEVKARFPETKIKWHKFEKRVLWALGIFYTVISLALYLNKLNSLTSRLDSHLASRT